MWDSFKLKFSSDNKIYEFEIKILNQYNVLHKRTSFEFFSKFIFIFFKNLDCINFLYMKINAMK